MFALHHKSIRDSITFFFLKPPFSMALCLLPFFEYFLVVVFLKKEKNTKKQLFLFFYTLRLIPAWEKWVLSGF